MKWRCAMRAVGAVGKEFGDSNCRLRLIGEVSKRGSRRPARRLQVNRKVVLARHRVGEWSQKLRESASRQYVYTRKWRDTR